MSYIAYIIYYILHMSYIAYIIYYILDISVGGCTDLVDL